MESLDRNNMFACTCDLEMDDVGRKPIETFLEAQIPSVGDIRAGRQESRFKIQRPIEGEQWGEQQQGGGVGGGPPRAA